MFVGLSDFTFDRSISQDDIIPTEKEAMATLLANEIMTLIYHGAILAKVWMSSTLSMVSVWRTA